MVSFLVESYVPKARDPAPRGLVRRLEAAARAHGSDIRYVNAIFVPEDETCFYLFESPTAEAVQEVSRRAGLRYERILETRT